MNPIEAKRLKKKLHDQYVRDVAAIDRVLELSLKPQRIRTIPPNVVAGNCDGREESGFDSFGHSNPEFENKILEIIKSRISGDFKVKDVIAVVGEADPKLAGRRSTISFAVSGLARKQKLSLIQPGRGRRPGIYRLA